MRILVTGNIGYLAPVLSRQLRIDFPGAALCLANAAAPPEVRFDAQRFGDTRGILPGLLLGMDTVVHQAAISDDPMGSRYETVTREINQDASIESATLASRAGVKSFVFASSTYGFAESGARREDHPVRGAPTS